ncbi:MAG: hypothetical protein GKR97_10575 [Rhizobiaceae bacterium]|nr:hypothetical protein [Rhizobiaceae bacterium]
MATLLKRFGGNTDVPERVQLELSGSVLSNAFQSLITTCDEFGGIERFAQAVSLKSTLFKDALADNKVQDLDLEALMGLCTFMSTVRRRIAPYLDSDGLTRIRSALVLLLDGASDTSTTDRRWKAFCDNFPSDRHHRWVRDFAAEILHGTDPERYPLMGRWVWDAGSNTGVVREIWHGDNVDHMTIPVPDQYETYVVLREELSQFLTSNGIFQNVLEYVDLLCARIYSDYINAQGGSYLKADFTSEADPMEHTRRILGLDGVKNGSSRTRLKSIDGESFVLDDTRLLN